MPFRLVQVATIFGLILFGATGSATAADLGPQLAAAEAIPGFHGSPSLNERELGAVSGFGLGEEPVPNGSEQQDISVILFDELGRPKGGEISAGTGSGSAVTSSVNVGVGQ